MTGDILGPANPTPPNPTTCQCEHANHFGVFRIDHQYGERSNTLRPIVTAYGTFLLCAGCRTLNHMTVITEVSK